MLYPRYTEKRNSFIEYIDSASAALEDAQIDDAQIVERLAALRRDILDDTFTVQVVGSFSNGKSTFINALMGADLLPTKALPCTAVINTISYGEHRSGTLHFLNPLPGNMIKSIPESTLEHMESHRDEQGNIEPMAIDPEHIKDYVTIPINDDHEETTRQSPYKAVDITLPNDLLRNGVRIIDSPGLNDNVGHTAITMDYLVKADAIIFLMNASQVCTQVEMETIRNILIPMGFKDIFFVVNRFDTVPRRERDDIRAYVSHHLRDIPHRFLGFTSAINTLDSKIDPDCDEPLPAFDFPAFEKALAEYLDTEKGEAKLARRAADLSAILDTIPAKIETRRNFLDSNIEQLLRQKEEKIPQLNLLKEKSAVIESQLRADFDLLLAEIRSRLNDKFAQLKASLPDRINRYPNDETLSPSNKKSLEDYSKRISDKVNSQVSEEVNKYIADELIPITCDRSVCIIRKYENELTAICDSIADLSNDISGTNVLGTDFRQLLADLPAQIQSNFFATQGVGLAIFTGLIFAVAIPPVLLVVGIISLVSGLIRGTSDYVSKKVKAKVAKLVTDDFDAKAKSSVDVIMTRFSERFGVIIDRAMSVINTNIDSLIAEINAAVDNIARQSADAEQQKAALTACSSRIASISSAL